MAAKTAKEQGHDVILWLWNEVGHPRQERHSGPCDGVNLTPLKDLLAAVQAASIPIWVCGACAVARQIGQSGPGVRRHDQRDAGLYQSGGGT